MASTMNYSQCCEWLYKQFASFQITGGKAYKPGLERIEELMRHFEDAHKAYSIIHLAGTNGKGSTSHMLHSIFMEAGYKVGLFTSPHMLDFKERIRINGHFIKEQFVCDFVNANKSYFEIGNYSFFEITLALAFAYFRDQEIEVLVLETGLGGRLDATNIVEPQLSIITNVSKDHGNFLGDDLRGIAQEKAGIIKRNTPVLVGEYQAAIADVFLGLSTERNSPLHWAKDFKLGNEPYKVQLGGRFQQTNAHTAWAASQLLKKHFTIGDKQILSGLAKVQENVFLPGRWQKVSRHPSIILDMAHNEGALKVLSEQLKEESFDSLHIVWGMMKDKEADAIIGLLPQEADYYLCQPESERAMPLDDLEKYFKKYELSYSLCDSTVIALTNSISNANKNDLILVAGSAYLIAELFEKYFKKSVGEMKFISIFATP